MTTIYPASSSKRPSVRHRKTYTVSKLKRNRPPLLKWGLVLYSESKHDNSIFEKEIK